MDSVNKYENNSIKKLMHRLGVGAEGLVLVHEGSDISARDIKFIYNRMKQASKDGTLCIFGSHKLNAKIEGDATLLTLTNQERILLASDKLLQLLVLEEDTVFASHPSLLIGSTGKYSKFFARTTELDYPYGPTSVFADFYDLNACVLFVGNVREIPEVRHAASLHKSVIMRNTCIKDGQVHSYLDYDCDTDFITEQLFKSNLLISESLNGLEIYGIRYRELMDFAKRFI